MAHTYEANAEKNMLIVLWGKNLKNIFKTMHMLYLSSTKLV